MPRRTIRLRLALLYGGVFLVSGAGLLAVTYLLVRNSENGSILYFKQQGGGVTAILSERLAGGRAASSGASRGRAIVHSQSLPAGPALRVGGGAPPIGLKAPSPRQARAQFQQLLTQAHHQHAAELHELLIKSGIALAIMAVISIGLGWLLAGRALRPLRTITAAARAISASSLHERLALAGPDDELRELGDTFDGLLARLEASFGAQREFVANASHELRTPLARQRTLIEVALGDGDATVGSLQANNRRVLAAGEQQERLIEALLTLARSERGLDDREPVDLAAIVPEALTAREPALAQRGLELRAVLRPVTVAGEKRLLEQMVANLLDNAIRHNSGGGWLEVATELRPGGPTLVVRNSGAHVAEEEVERMLRPFGRLGGERVTGQEGLGLGLSIVQAIAGAHGAMLRVRPQPQGGLAVAVDFVAQGTVEGRVAPDARAAPEPAGVLA